MPNKFDDAHMKVAETYAKLSSATRLKVGSIIVKDDRIISIGYNGTPAGWDNDCENKEWCSAGGWLSPEEIVEGWPYEGSYLDAAGNTMQGRYRLKTKPEVIHAEMNAIGKLAKSAESGKNATMYITHAPCFECAKLIHIAGIKKVFYREQYRNTEGLEFLDKCNIEVEKI
jgi:dCMP deaminase